MKDLSWLESYSSVNMSIFNTIFWNLLEFAEINYGKKIPIIKFSKFEQILENYDFWSVMFKEL